MVSVLRRDVTYTFAVHVYQHIGDNNLVIIWFNDRNIRSELVTYVAYRYFRVYNNSSITTDFVFIRFGFIADTHILIIGCSLCAKKSAKAT